MSPGWQRNTSRDSPSSTLRKPRGGRSFVLENGTAIASQASTDASLHHSVDTSGSTQALSQKLHKEEAIPSPSLSFPSAFPFPFLHVPSLPHRSRTPFPDCSQRVWGSAEAPQRVRAVPGRQMHFALENASSDNTSGSFMRSCSGG